MANRNFNKFRTIPRNRKITSVDYRKVTVSDILSADWDSLKKLPKDELYKFAKKASDLAIARRKRALDTILKEDLPIPQSYRNWRTQNINDDFSLKNAKVDDISALRDALGKDYDMGYATIDMRVSKSMDTNELIHKIRVASDFLDNETSTAKGWKMHLTEFAKRVGERGNFKLTSSDYKDIWSTYNALLSLGIRPETKVYGTSKEIQQVIFEVANERGSFNKDIILNEVIKRLNGEYEEMSDEEEYGGFYEFRKDKKS